MMKKMCAAVLGTAMLVNGITFVNAEGEAANGDPDIENSVMATDSAVTAEAEEAELAADTSSFDPETVMWTNNPIENVLAQAGIYSNAAEINPNAAKTDTGVQNPYSNQGTSYNGWEYAEYCWTNFYPIGNGRMAGMVAGGIDKEVIQINEDTCWDGSPYGTLQNESGASVSDLASIFKATAITVDEQTGGSVTDGWRFFRGANADGTPAEIGAENVVVGDEAFRENFSEYANTSISNRALNTDNSKTQEAVQYRWTTEKLVEYAFLGKPSSQRAYKSFAEVYLDFGHSHSSAENYVKSLDMTKGIVTVEYDYGEAHYKRESFASYPDQTVATHVESDAPLAFSATLHTYHSDKEGYYSYEKVSDKEVKLKAAITNGSKDNNDPGTVNAVQLEARMILDGDGAFTVSSDNTTISVNGGNQATIYVVGATNYVNYLELDNTKQGRDCDIYSANVKSKTYEEIKNRHLQDFTQLFSLTDVNIDNAEGVDYSSTPTEERVRQPIDGSSAFLTGAGSKLATANSNKVYSTYSMGDNQLAALEFNYGKYLLISGSRDGKKATEAGDIDIPESQPLNLTGKWNAALSASWKGKYTININTEMNYWAAQPLNLAECERPLIDVLGELAQSGSITAANQYAIYNDRGDNTYQPGDPWVTHHNFDLWRGTQPIDNATAGLWPTGGAWLLDHAWQYYKFTGDKDYLAQSYPYMVGAAKFFTQFLVIDPETGYLVTAASCSPEQGGVQPGAAMDTQLIRNLYNMVIEASEELGKSSENAELIAKINEQMPSSYLADEQGKIAPNLIDSAGIIKEWARGDVSFDISETTDTSKIKWTVTDPFTSVISTVYDHSASNTTAHRHCSHLWEIFPGAHLNAYSTDSQEQSIFKAFQKSVSARGAGSGQGWGLAWRIGLNARALNASSASEMLEQLFTTRTSPNLFDQHPNFQIDGNYGATAGIIEMLIQSHDGAIDLLPAIPADWQSGSFKGINTREGATVDVEWSEGKPVTAQINAAKSGNLKIRNKYVGKATVKNAIGDEVPASISSDGTELTFYATENSTYTLTGFGSTVVERDVELMPADAKTFYATDGGTAPKLASGGATVGYLYNRDGVKMGYTYEDVDFDGLNAITLNMDKVRDSNIYVIITVDSLDGTEIANQIIATGLNELELKGLEGISGTHTIYVSYIQNPYASGQKYLGDARELTLSYKSIDGGDDTDPDSASTETSSESTTESTTESASQEGLRGDVDNNGKLTANDVSALLAYVLNPEYKKDTWIVNSHVADVDSNGIIDGADSALILKKVLNSAAKFADEK